MEKLIKSKIRNMRPIYKIAFYILLGGLWSLANVGYSIGFISWFALVPYLFIIRNEKFNEGMLYSLIFGTAVYFFHFLWIPDAVYSKFIAQFFPDALKSLGVLSAWLVLVIISIYHGLAYFIIYVIARYISKKKGFYLYFPLIYTVIDTIFPKLFHDRLGYSQYMFYEFSQSADLLGVALITFLIIASNVSAIMIIESLMLKKGREAALSTFLVVILAITGLSVYGAYRIKTIKLLEQSSEKAKISIVQGNISGEDKNNMESREIVNVYNRLTLPLKDLKPDLVVWPETSVPSLLYSTMNDLSSTIHIDGLNILYGTHVMRIDSVHKYSLFNALILSDKNRMKAAFYYKSKLLPFVESIPIKRLNFLFNLVGYSYFSEGYGPQIIESGKIKFAPSICYEAINPYYTLRSMEINDKKANLLVNATNDSWFGNSTEPKMHLHMARFRTIETRRAMARSTCTGYSALISPTGEFIARSGLFEEAVLTADLPLLEIETVYASWGKYFAFVLTILLGILLIIRKIHISMIEKKRRLRLEAMSHSQELIKLWYN